VTLNVSSTVVVVVIKNASKVYSKVENSIICKTIVYYSTRDKSAVHEDDDITAAEILAANI